MDKIESTNNYAKDVKIEVVLSEIQSFYYDFKNMYVDEYTEVLSKEDGASTFEFVLKSQYIDSDPNFETGNSGIGKFRDKAMNQAKEVINDHAN
jgi:hypothetical protein